MRRRADLVTADVSEKRIASIIRVTRIGLMLETIRSCEILILIRVTRRNTPEDAILHSHRRENLKCYSEQ
jgi:hypothetical protein